MDIEGNGCDRLQMELISTIVGFWEWRMITVCQPDVYSSLWCSVAEVSIDFNLFFRYLAWIFILVFNRKEVEGIGTCLSRMP